ncbi:MAG TPA: hypothetical protein VNE62_13205 [Actinomycetota bacterium]|nr:hypothetical protein [Actinomycetota bacterium]
MRLRKAVKLGAGAAVAAVLVATGPGLPSFGASVGASIYTSRYASTHHSSHGGGTWSWISVNASAWQNAAADADTTPGVQATPDIGAGFRVSFEECSLGGPCKGGTYDMNTLPIGGAEIDPATGKLSGFYIDPATGDTRLVGTALGIEGTTGTCHVDLTWKLQLPEPDAYPYAYADPTGSYAQAGAAAHAGKSTIAQGTVCGTPFTGEYSSTGVIARGDAGAES